MGNIIRLRELTTMHNVIPAELISYPLRTRYLYPVKKCSENGLKRVKIFRSQVFLPKKSLKFPYMVITLLASL